MAAADLLNAWFRAVHKPERPDVNRLLRKVREVELETIENRDGRVVTLMLMARSEHWLGEKLTADSLAIEAFKEAEGDSVAMRIWFDDLIERFHTAESDGSKEAFAFLEKKADELGALPPIIRLVVLRNDMIFGVPFDECLRQLQALEGEVQDDRYSKLEFHRLQNQLFYAMGRYEDCVAACRAGLEILPTDLELNNNLAYTLAKHQGDPEGALPYAEAAAQAAPLNAAVLDTLGWVYYESERYRDAERVLNLAIATARTPDELVPAYLHLAQTKQATGDPDEARKFIGMARTQLQKANKMIVESYAEDVNAVAAELGR